MTDNDNKLSARSALAHAAYLAVCDQTVKRDDFLKLARIYFDLISDAAEVGVGENAVTVLTMNVEHKGARHDDRD